MTGPLKTRVGKLEKATPCAEVEDHRERTTVWLPDNGRGATPLPEGSWLKINRDGTTVVDAADVPPDPLTPVLPQDKDG